MLETGFDLVKKLIGKGGCNTRKIFEATQTKIRVRGKGSGHKERNGREAPVPLMIALAADQISSDFQTAFHMTMALLDDVSQRFDAFLRVQKLKKLQLGSGGRRYWVGEISDASIEHLGAMLDGLLSEGSDTQCASPSA